MAEKKPRKEKKKISKGNLILNAAYELFLEKGFDNTSIDEITRKSNVAKGTFYLYFEDKIDLRNQIIIEKSKEVVEKAYQEVKDKKFSTRENKFIAFCDYIIEYMNNNPKLLRLIHKNISTSLYKEALEKNEDNSIIKKTLKELQEEFKDTYTEEEFMINLFIILEMLGSVIYSSIIRQEPLGIEEMKPYLYKNIRKIIRN